MRHWDFDYNGHRIRVENEALAERLIIDGTLQDEHRGLASQRILRGAIIDPSGASEPVVAALAEGTDEGVACRISVGGRPVYSSPNARAS